MNHLVCMLIKKIMNCLVDSYLGLCARRIFVPVHGVDLRLWCANVWCAGVEEIYTLCVLKFSLIGILDACLRGIFVKGAWVNFLVGRTISDRREILKFCTIIN